MAMHITVSSVDIPSSHVHILHQMVQYKSRMIPTEPYRALK